MQDERHHRGLVERLVSWSSTRRDQAECILPDPSNTLTDRLNIALNSSGSGYVLQLCQNARYLIQAPILFAASNQEISTVGYPTGDERAILVVNGPVFNGTGHTTAIDGTCADCDGVKLRNIQIDGTRQGAPPTSGGANIEMGGPNSDQVIEYVRSFDPRGWSCLHVQEGGLTCTNVLVQNNDIGPCGSDAFQEWADGVSIACQNATVRNNLIHDPTDGGIVLFGSPGSLVENNTIWIVNSTLLGGINMVDIDPWGGNYTGSVVQNNTIIGGFATDSDTDGDARGTDLHDAIVKIGIAVGPRTWFSDRYGSNVSFSGNVIGNTLTGAFGFGIAVTSARNFTIEDNILSGNTSFIGSSGPNCTLEAVPSPVPFLVAPANVTESSIQSDFETVANGDGLTCILPPDGDYWPYGGQPTSPSSPPTSVPEQTQANDGPSDGTKAGIAIGVIVGVVAAALAAWYIRKWAIRRQQLQHAASLGDKGFEEGQ
ncbi:hypothetical protein OF83DRAFT_736540 [Amylostereum chailletii]|nr:hypothetical protein OF83DRAFT_736540 [Amylostereum chailletii]